MVKADVTRNYYADLDLPSTASEDEIKRAFRTLAKVFHPDRNAGKEVDAVPKFQAVQAAYEVLADPEQKRRYDQERAKVRLTAPNLPRRGPVPPPNFPPPPRRTAPTAARQNPFNPNANAGRARAPAPPPPPPPPPPTAAPAAETYRPYAKASAKQYETAKEETKSRSDAKRGFQTMRPGHSPTGERFAHPPPPPPRPQNQYPTPPRPANQPPKSASSIPNETPRPRRSWDDFNGAGRKTTTGTEIPTSIPNLARTQSTRKHGFMPATPQGDEPPAPRSSAYATYGRPQPPNAQSYFAESPAPPPHQGAAQRPVVSPLRQSRSSSGIDQETTSQRPNLERISTRYAAVGGERTDVKSAGVGRSSSVRNSPINPKWYEPDQNGLQQTQSQDEYHRKHRSSSPNSRRPQPAHVQVDSSSDSGTSSDDEVKKTWSGRPSGPPRHATHHYTSSDTRQFPGTNYVKGPPQRETDGSHYPSQHKRPPARGQPVSHAAFNYVPGYAESHQTGQVPAASVGSGYPGPGKGPGAPNMYDPFHYYPKPSPNKVSVPSPGAGKETPMLNGFPSWAVPSSVLPPTTMPRRVTQDLGRDGKTGSPDQVWADSFLSKLMKNGYKPRSSADSHLCSTATTNAQNVPNARPSDGGVENGEEKFSAADWNDKFAGAGHMFSPPVTQAYGRRSPTRSAKTRSKSYSSTHTASTKESSGNDSTVNIPKQSSGGSAASDAFLPGKFSAEEWSERLKYHATANSLEGEPKKTASRGSRPPAPDRLPHINQTAQKSPIVAATSDGLKDAPGISHQDNVDPMDLDDSLTSDIPLTQYGSGGPSKPTEVAQDMNGGGNGNTYAQYHGSQAEGHVNLEDLANTAPFKPSGTGLGDLGEMTTTLPFGSKASASRPDASIANGFTFSSLQALSLPKPPKEVIAPLEVVGQESWQRYVAEIADYMRGWQAFNKKMLGHFQLRQVQLETALSPSWVTAIGDGPSGNDVSYGTNNGLDGFSTQRAGYAAYKQWMEEDIKVREWWTVACERHEKVILDLGKVREKVRSV